MHGDEQPSDVDLVHCPFWICICNLPMSCKDKEPIMKIGSSLGEILELNDLDVNLWGHYVWIRVSIDVSQPLK